MQPADDVLRGIPMFRRVSADDRQRLLAVARVRHLERDATVFEEGQPSDYFPIVLTGRVKVFRTTPSGKEIILEIFGAGDPLGAVAVYESAPFPATAVTLEPTDCLIIQRRDFFALLESHPSLVRSLLLGLTHRLVELTSRLTELTGGRVETRFARFFLKLGAEMGRKDPARGGIVVPMPLSRQELADLTGTTIETAIRIMSRWNKDNVLRTDRDAFVIVDMETLKSIADT
jgi:CRP/FNR family transcriptional regulator, nitrogen oxide reductase regulator